MRMFHFIAFVIGVLALSVAAASAEASPILNILEVQKLVASETASDHARLAAHFAAPSNQRRKRSSTRRCRRRSGGIRPGSSEHT